MSSDLEHTRGSEIYKVLHAAVAKSGMAMSSDLISPQGLSGFKLKRGKSSLGENSLKTSLKIADELASRDFHYPSHGDLIKKKKTR